MRTKLLPLANLSLWLSGYISLNLGSQIRLILLNFITFAVAVSFLSLPAKAQDKLPPFEVAPIFAQYHAPALSKAVTDQLELGGRFSWNWLPHLSLEAEYASTLRKPLAESNFDGGYFSQALFGVKTGVRWKKWGLFAKFRPGLVSYSMVITSFNAGQFGFGRLNTEAFDVGGGAEFFISRHWLFRYDGSDLITRQGAHSISINTQRVTFLPFTDHNFEAEVAVAFRF